MLGSNTNFSTSQDYACSSCAFEREATQESEECASDDDTP